jgi:hypothetical protein
MRESRYDRDELATSGENRAVRRVIRLLREVEELAGQWTRQHDQECGCVFCTHNGLAGEVWVEMKMAERLSEERASVLDDYTDPTPEEAAARMAEINAMLAAEEVDRPLVIRGDVPDVVLSNEDEARVSYDYAPAEPAGKGGAK